MRAQRQRRRTPRGGLALAAAVGLLAAALPLVTGCAGDERDHGENQGAGAAPDSITVFAAASLTETFTEIGRRFEARDPGAHVTFNFASSATLAAQINQGAPADVFAAASRETMRTVTDAGAAAGDATVFARNQLVIAVPKRNAKAVTSLGDLRRPGMKVALCDERVPAGAAAKRVFTAAGFTITAVTLERDVKAALAKVKLGEVDAALVYRTDAAAASSEVVGVEFPESSSAINDYPIVALAGARSPAAARAFVEFVLSDKGTSALSAAGFQRP